MYKDYYLQASKLADKIRAGDLPKRPEVEAPLVSTRQKEEPKQESTMSKYQDIIGMYMAKLRPSEEELQAKPKLETVANKNPVTGDLGQALKAIKAVESRGSGGYSALGPVMEKGSYKGDRAYGAYQVMGRNIPSWTKEALGVEMTPEEFLADEAAQDKVASSRLSKYHKQHGTWEDAASVWFSGQPLAKARGRSDGYNTVDQYVTKFRNEFGDKPIMKRRDNA